MSDQNQESPPFLFAQKRKGRLIIPSLAIVLVLGVTYILFTKGLFSQAHWQICGNWLDLKTATVWKFSAGGALEVRDVDAARIFHGNTKHLADMKELKYGVFPLWELPPQTGPVSKTVYSREHQEGYLEMLIFTNRPITYAFHTETGSWKLFVKDEGKLLIDVSFGTNTLKGYEVTVEDYYINDAGPASDGIYNYQTLLTLSSGSERRRLLLTSGESRP